MVLVINSRKSMISPPITHSTTINRLVTGGRNTVGGRQVKQLTQRNYEFLLSLGFKI